MTIRRHGLAAAALLCLGPTLAHAQTTERSIRSAPGKTVRVGVYSDIRPDCTSGPLPAIRLAALPAHGSVTVKRGTLKATNLKQCLATEVPVFVAYYRAADGYSGADAFTLLVTWPSGRKEVQHYRVSVGNNPGGDQHI